MTDLIRGEDLPERLDLSEARALSSRVAERSVSRASEPAGQITRHMCSSMGKGVRSLLLLICAADDSLTVPSKAVFAAAAIEIFHLATLVHDDIIDEAATRRGKESVQSRFGKKNAVITGDYLLCVALSTAAGAVEESDFQNDTGRGFMLFKKYMNSFTKICLGEMDEAANSRNLALSPRRYLKIISGKTAELFRISAAIGAAVSGAEELSQTGLIGWYLGMSFQIIDDCKDYGFNSESALKPVKHDLTQGVVTLPLILTLAKDPVLRGLAKEVISQNRESERLTEAVVKAGGVEMAMDTARRYAEKAAKLTDSLFDGLKRDKLRELIANALSSSKAFGG
ncbi:MAG: polyprenyl synthetase family protein [Clostridiales bacterium]|jgi:heptaprenyl diphosphate synthase|nr:polyprenyl synthetase family protein [Clostridiales bacterium]